MTTPPATDFAAMPDRELDAWLHEHAYGKCAHRNQTIWTKPPERFDGWFCEDCHAVSAPGYSLKPPAYSTDHAPAHALGVRMAEMGLAFEYALELTCMIAGTTEPCTAKDLFDLTQATTRQRAEAAARAVEAAERSKVSA